MRRLIAGLAGLVAALLATVPALAAPPVEVVHAEHVQVGPYDMRVSFSEWPLLADRSLDFTFAPADGISAHKGTLRMVAPSGEVLDGRVTPARDAEPLVRHPRSHDVWGIDTFALPEQGMWAFELTVEGPQGPGTGTLGLDVGARPGPPAGLSWAIGVLPLLAALAAVGYGWYRVRPGRLSGTRAWT